MAGLEIEGEGSVDDWLDNPSPPPRPLGEAAHAPAKRKAPARPGAKPAAAPPAAPKKSVTPLDQLGADLDAAPDAPHGERLDPPEDAPPRPKPPPEGQRGGSGGGHDRPSRPRGEIWEGCPVTPLGVNGAVSYYLDTHGQMIKVPKHDAQSIMHLFGAKIPALCRAFPQYDKDGGLKLGRFDQTSSAMAMMQAASERGLFDPNGAVRGVGAWCDDDGQLIYHTGDRLIMGGEIGEPCSHQGRIYPAYPPIPHPAAAVRGVDPAPEILEKLATWNWARPEIDPWVSLGMICVQMMSGALKWRPTFWGTGPRAAGKSAFQELMQALHGPKGLIQSTDTTKSGITSQIGHSSLPVALDELEPGDEGSGKEAAIIDLARVASSGGQWFRGTADQKGVSGNVYSSFFFSSILIPGRLNAADLSRLIILDFLPFAEGTPTPPALRPDQWRKRGAALKRLLIDRWPTWAERLDLWRDAFARVGVGGRNGDNWATTLAMADMALHRDLPALDLLDAWAAKVARHIKSDLAELGNDADALLTHLLTQRFDPLKGREVFTVAQWLQVAGALPHAPPILGNDAANQGDPEALRDYAKKANRMLAQIGLRVSGEGHEAQLFIAQSKIQGLLDLFKGTAWTGGAWTQSARRIKGAIRGDGVRTLAGTPTRGTEVPFTAMPGLLAFPMDRAAPREPAPMPPGMEDFA